MAHTRRKKAQPLPRPRITHLLPVMRTAEALTVYADLPIRWEALNALRLRGEGPPVAKYLYSNGHRAQALYRWDDVLAWARGVKRPWHVRHPHGVPGLPTIEEVLGPRFGDHEFLEKELNDADY